MAATMKREQELLWDSVKTLSSIDKAKAEAVLKTTIEKSLLLLDLYTPILSSIHFSIPDEEYLLKLKEMDTRLQEQITDTALEKQYEFAVEYIDMLSGISDEPTRTSKKILASLLAQRKRRNRLRLVKRQTVKPINAIQKGGAQYYTPNEVAKKLGLSDQTIRRMCEKGKFRGAYKTDGGHWKIPEDNFITSREQDSRAEEVFRHIERKNSELGDVDEFDL